MGSAAQRIVQESRGGVATKPRIGKMCMIGARGRPNLKIVRFHFRTRVGLSVDSELNFSPRSVQRLVRGSHPVRFTFNAIDWKCESATFPHLIEGQVFGRGWGRGCG